MVEYVTTRCTEIVYHFFQYFYEKSYWKVLRFILHEQSNPSTTNTKNQQLSVIHIIHTKASNQ